MARTPRVPRTPTTGRTPRTPATAASSALFDPSEIVDIPDGINSGLSSPKNATLIQIFGMPRDTVDRKCRGVTNEPLKSMIVTDDVGPFRVTGLNLAVASLKKVLNKVKKDEPETYESLGTAGMLCVRFIKNSTKLSNHSWGCAVDIKIDGALDGISVGGGTGGKDGKTLAGLAAMAPYFNEAGWYWGVGFSSFEDGMHFEIAEETLRDWHAKNKLGDLSKRTVTDSNLSIGDKGADVRELQETLQALGYDILPDGHFGPITHGIVMDYQAANGLHPDGIVGPNTKKSLGL